MSLGSVCIIVENLSVPFDRRVWQEAQTLKRAGYDVSVVCPKGHDRDTSDRELMDGVTIRRYSLPSPTSSGLVDFAREYWTAVRESRRLLAELGHFDVIHLCNPPDILFLATLGLRQQRHRPRVVFDQHDLVPELYLSRFRPRRDAGYWACRVAERLTYARADLVIATNESYKDVAVTRGGVSADKVFVVRSAPDLSRFPDVEPDFSVRNGRKHLIGYLGVMGPQDGIDYALKALSDLAQIRADDDWHAVFVGGGDSFEEMRSLATRLGLDERTTFTGRVSDQRVAEILGAADVCLAPDPLNPLNDVSTMNKILEYMLLGKPIVSFDLKEARVSADTAALYAEPNDTKQFAHAISHLLDNPKERAERGEHGRRRVLGPLSWEHSEKELLACYSSLAAAD